MQHNIEYLDIDNSSPYALEQELRGFPKLLFTVHQACSTAVRELEDLELELKILTSDVIAEIYSQKDPKPPPPSMRGEVRQSMVPANKKWQELSKKIIAHRQDVNNLKGLVESHEARGYRISELCSMTQKQLRMDEPRVYDKIKQAGDNVEY